MVAFTQGFPGTIAEVRVTGFFFGNDRLRVQSDNYMTPKRFYGVGAADFVDDALKSAVAVPLSGIVSFPAFVEFDVLAKSLMPEAGTPVISITRPALFGVATIVAGKVRYTPNAGFAGEDNFQYALTNGTKVSRADIFVSVSSVGTGIPHTPPSGGLIRNVPSVAYPTLQAALTNAPSNTRVRLANGTYNESFTTNVSGNANTWVIIESVNRNGAILTGNIRLLGAYTWWHDVTFRRQQPAQTGETAPLKATDAAQNYYSLVFRGYNHRVTRSVVDSPVAFMLYQGGATPPDCGNIDITYNTFTGSAGPLREGTIIGCGDVPPHSPGPPAIQIAYNLFNLQTPSTGTATENRYIVYWATNAPGENQTGVCDLNFHHNYITTLSHIRQFILSRHPRLFEMNYVKSASVSVIAQGFLLRRGGWSPTDGEPIFADHANNRSIIRGNVFDRVTARINDTDSEWISNDFINGSECVLRAGSSIPGGGGVHSAAHRTTLVDNVVTAIELGEVVNTLDAAQGGRLAGVVILRGRGNPTPLPVDAGITDPPTGLPGGYSIANGIGSYTGQTVAPIDGPTLLAQVGHLA